MNRTQKLLKIFKIIAGILWWSLTAIVVIVIFTIMSAKLKGEVPYFFGYSVMNIVSGSMEDTIPEGSYILVKKTDPEEIRKGDIICFYSDDPAIKGYPNTHTVVEDPIQGENGLEFVTKGDANPLKDTETAKGDKLIGRYVTNLNLLTSFSKALEGNGIIVISIVLLGLCAAFMIATAFIKTSAKDSNDDSEEKINDDPKDSNDDSDAQTNDDPKDQENIDTPQE